MKKFVVAKNNKIIYFFIVNKRTNYYKAKLQKNKITNKQRISKKEFFKQILRIKQ